MKALGMIEVYGYLSAVEALDSALKAANVALHSVTKVKGGLVTVIVAGDVGAVKAAIDASSAAAERVGRVISVHVIPRPAMDVFEMTQTPLKIEKQPLINKEEKTKPEEPKEAEKPKERREVEKPKEAEKIIKEIKEDSHYEVSKEELEQKTVEELRQIARALHMGSMTKNEIKFAKKRQLIKAIGEFNEGGDK